MSFQFPARPIPVAISGKHYKGMPNIVVTRYAVDSNAAVILMSDSGEHICTLSANLPDVQLRSGEFVFRNYGTNEGILEELVGDGVIETTGREVRNGFVKMPICRFTPRFLGYGEGVAA